jgi:hypothetical protein
MNYGKSWAHRLALNTLIVAAVLVPHAASAQVTSQQITATALPLPIVINPAPGVTDFGNGPLELRIVQGSARFATSSGSGVAAGSACGTCATGLPSYTGQGVLTVQYPSTLIILNATPTTPPCVGCLISAGANPSLTSITIPQYVFVTAASGTQISVSTNVTINAQTPLAWGAACPTTPAVAIPMQASVGGDIPFYTLARLCGYGNNGPGAAVLPFPIGGH